MRTRNRTRPLNSGPTSGCWTSLTRLPRRWMNSKSSICQRELTSPLRFDPMIGLLGKKLGQTRVYDAQGNLIPVTVVLAGPNRVVQCKTVEKDGYKAVQLGFDDQKE